MSRVLDMDMRIMIGNTAVFGRGSIMTFILLDGMITLGVYVVTLAGGVMTVVMMSVDMSTVAVDVVVYLTMAGDATTLTDVLAVPITRMDVVWGMVVSLEVRVGQHCWAWHQR